MIPIIIFKYMKLYVILNRTGPHTKLFAEWFANQPNKLTCAVLTDEACNEIRSFLLGSYQIENHQKYVQIDETIQLWV